MGVLARGWGKILDIPRMWFNSTTSTKTEESDDMTFEDLAKLENPHKRFAGTITTPFWEELYQLFKIRMLEEQSSNKPNE